MLAISVGGLALYILAAVALREAFGLNGLAAAFTVAATAAGIVVAAVLARRLEIEVGRVVRDWVVAPALLAAAFTVGVLAVWLPFGGAHDSFGAALATAVAAGVAGLATLAAGVLVAGGLERSLLRRAAVRLRGPAPFERQRHPS